VDFVKVLCVVCRCVCARTQVRVLLCCAVLSQTESRLAMRGQHLKTGTIDLEPVPSPSCPSIPLTSGYTSVWNICGCLLHFRSRSRCVLVRSADLFDIGLFRLSFVNCNTPLFFGSFSFWPPIAQFSWLCRHFEVRDSTLLLASGGIKG
jgi:hypothetical protein